MDNGSDSVRGWVEDFKAAWEAAWSPGKRIIIDESMIFWGGGGNVHLTWLPRKPTPMGACMKLAACDSGGVMLRVEVMESKVVDRKRPFFKEWVASTGTTLCPAQLWFGSSCVIFGDSWFGSYKTVHTLMGFWLYSILNVKTGHKHFPK